MRAAPAAGLLLLGVASARAEDVVTVGGQTKTKVATVVSMESGDVACYLQLEDGRGRRFQELADFDVCARRELVGRRVSLTYELANVMADECQGDPDCTKTKRLPLVVKATVLAAAPRAATTAAASLCRDGEEVAFACRTGRKLVSVCAVRGPGALPSVVQYRFGTPERIEMAVPDPPSLPAGEAARGGSEAFSGGGLAWLRFRRGDHAYVVYTAVGRFGPDGATATRDGVVVERASRRIADLRCDNPPTSLLGPDWFGALRITSGGETFDLPE